MEICKATVHTRLIIEKYIPDKTLRLRNEKGAMMSMDYDLVVIGSGPAGEKGAAEAAYFGKKVALIEKAPHPGGAGINTGTVHRRLCVRRRYIFPACFNAGYMGSIIH